MRKRRELTPVADRTATIRPPDILLFATLRNERVRLPYFLQYYRDLGVNHFLIVDNDLPTGRGNGWQSKPMCRSGIPRTATSDRGSGWTG